MALQIPDEESEGENRFSKIRYDIVEKQKY